MAEPAGEARAETVNRLREISVGPVAVAAARQITDMRQKLVARDIRVLCGLHIKLVKGIDG